MAFISFNWCKLSIQILFAISSLFSFSLCVIRENSLELPDPQQNIMPFEPVRYSRANVSNNYKSSTKFNARGMGHLYYITRKFMDLVLEEQPYPEGWLEVDENGGLTFGSWQEASGHWGRVLALAGIGLVIAVFLPFVGLIFCCSRCCFGKCGARTRPFDSKHDTCKRHSYAFLLSSLTILILFGVVCAFVTNEYMEEGAKALPSNARTSVQDTQLYLKNTKQEVNTLLVTNFKELDAVLNRLLHKSGEIVKDKLGAISKAAVLSNLTSIVLGLKVIREDLKNIDSLTNELRENALNLEEALKKVRGDLLEKLISCIHEPPCKEFLAKYNITNLSLETNFTQLPDVSLSLQNVSALLASNIEIEVMKGKKEFDRIKYSIQNSVDKIIPEISKEIIKAGALLKEKAAEVTGILDKVGGIVQENSNKPIDQTEIFINRFGHYRYYIGIGVSCTLLGVLSCLGLGLLCGYCGKRPDHYSDDCCDKGTAARFLLLGVWLMFLSGSALILLSILGLVSGSLVERGVCGALREPTTIRSFGIIDKLLPLDEVIKTGKQLNLSTLITECHRNSSVYKVLGMEAGSVGSEYLARFDIPRRVKELADSIVLGGSVTIITSTAERQLRALAASSLNNISLTFYTSILKEKITSIDLMQMAAAMNQTAMKLPPNQAQVKRFLLTEAMYLETHQERQVGKMQKMANALHSNATLLSHHLRFNKSSLREAVDHLLQDVNHAQKVLNTKGPDIVKKLAEDFGKEFRKHIEEYLARVESEGEENIGKCWPLSNVYNATIIATCNNLLDPFNGFWLSVGVIVLLYLPALILAVKLSTLYQKLEPYPGAAAESEYLYDTYGERESSIPLASIGVEKKRSKKKKGGRKVTTGEGFHPRPPTHAPAPNDRQWEELGPPRYQSPPLSSEYERPPPYYYPGPNPSTGGAEG